MVNRVLIQTEIDYKIKKRIIHLDENHFWNHEQKKRKKKQKSISKSHSIFSAFHPLLSTFYWNTKMLKGKRSIRDRQTIIIENSHEFALAFPLCESFRLVHEYFLALLGVH